jgi:hypothetical protein
MFNLFVADQIERNASGPNAGENDKALLDAHNALSSNLVAYCELFFVEESINWDEIRVQWNAAMLDGAWSMVGSFRVMGKEFKLSDVTPKSSKNLKDHAKDFCKGIIHRSDVRSLTEQGFLETPTDVAQSSTQHIHAVAQADPDRAHGGTGAIGNPTIPHNQTNNTISSIPRPLRTDPNSFNECPGCKKAIAKGGSTHEADCPVSYLIKKQKKGEKSFKRSNKHSIVRVASAYFASLSAFQQEKCRRSAACAP